MNGPYEWQIGWRYTRAGRSGRRNGFISFISFVSVLGIALGVAALIIVLSVMNGFQKEVRDRMLSVIAHVEIFDAAGAAPVNGGSVWGSGFDTSATPVLRRMNMGANVEAFGATRLALSAGVETNGNGNSCGFRQLPAFEATKGSREVGLRQGPADGLVLQQVLGHYGRAAQ